MKAIKNSNKLFWRSKKIVLKLIFCAKLHLQLPTSFDNREKEKKYEWKKKKRFKWSQKLFFTRSVTATNTVENGLLWKKNIYFDSHNFATSVKLLKMN